MKFVLLIAWVLVFGAVREIRSQPTEEVRDGLAELVVPLDKPSAFLEWAEKSLDLALRGIDAKEKIAPRSGVLKSGKFVLWGDLFKTGDCFALAEIAPQSEESDFYGVAFAKWTGGKWELRGCWKIPTIWRPEGWKAGEDDYLHTTPATQPFELCELSGDKVPEVVIAGEVEKYYQEHYLLKFLRQTGELKLVATAMARPEVAGQYLKLSYNSGRRAIWGEWRFFKWRGDGLVPVVTWHDEVGYGTEDPTFSEGSRMDGAGKSETLRIGYGKGMEYEAETYELTRNEKPFGRMRVVWKDEKNRNAMNSDEIEKAWLFEKTTGLPRMLYPGREGNGPIPRLEDFASVSVEGNAEAEELFSMAKK